MTVIGLSWPILIKQHEKHDSSIPSASKDNNYHVYI